MKMQENKAITLIALVITIIVLIILAGVAINLAFGQNGLVTRAKAARGEYSTAEAKEKLEQEILNVQIQAVQEGKDFNLKYLKEKIDKTKYEITLDDDENPTTAVIKEIGSNYYLTVDSKLKVTKVEEKAPKPQYVKFSDITWASGKASVELSTKEAGTIEYKVGKDGIYQAGTTISNLSNGDIVYVRVNNNGTYTDEETLEIKDTILPEEFTITASDITYEGVKLTGSTQDNQTGIKDYTYVAATGDTIVKEIANQTATEYTITGLDEETEYVVYMLAYDNAGNVRKSNEETIKTTKKLITAVNILNQYVDYSIDIDGNATDYDWKVFYIEEDVTSPNYGATYIIPDYYVLNSKITTAINNAGMTQYSGGKYRAYWESAPSYKKVTDNVKTIFMYTESMPTTMTHIQCISRLLDTETWEKELITEELKEKGGLAIGAPTIELWCASWNKLYPTQKLTFKSGNINSSNSLGISSYNGYKTAPNIFFPTKKVDSDGTSEYWVAGYSSFNSGALISVSNSGYIGCSNTYGSRKNWIGIRPVVYLPPTVTLEKDKSVENLWHINYGE